MCNKNVLEILFIHVDSFNNQSSPLFRKRAVRRSPHSVKKPVVKETKEFKEERELSFTDTGEFGDFVNVTEPVARQRGGSTVFVPHQETGIESRSKSVTGVLETSSGGVSDLEKTVNFGENSDHLVAKEKLELESSKKVSPVVMRKAVDLQRSRERRGTLFDDDDDDDLGPSSRPKHNIISGTAAAAAAAAAASKSEV